MSVKRRKKNLKKQKKTMKRTNNDDTLHVCANAHKHYKKKSCSNDKCI